MQPIILYVERGKDGIPEDIVLGHAPQGTPVTIRQNELLNKHFLLRGTSGVGKSRMLALLLMEILSRGLGRVIFIDPLGEVYNLVHYWYSYLYREYSLKGQQRYQWFTEQILGNTVFMDLSQKDHPFRHKMLQPLAGEDVSDVISRQIKFFDAFLSASGSEAAMDSQLQRRSNYVSLISIFAATNTSLKEGKKFVYDREWREILMNQAEQRCPIEDVKDAVAHFRYLDQEFKGRVAEKLNSLETALSPFFENPCVRNFLLAGENNVDFHDILNHKTLFIKTPVADIPVRKLLFNYFYTMFFTLSEKRTTADPVFLGSDESALVFNSMMADYITRIRNYHVYLINSHQSLGQMLTEEGMKIAKTIESQSRIKIFFRHDYEESEEVAKELFNPQGLRPKQIEVTTSISKTASESSSTGIAESFSKETGQGIGYSTGEQQNQTSTKTYAISDAQNFGETLTTEFGETDGYSDTVSWNFGNIFTFSESASRGIQQLKGQGVTFTLKDGQSIMEIETDSGSTTETTGQSETDTTSKSSSNSQSIARSETHTHASGTGGSEVISDGEHMYSHGGGGGGSSSESHFHQQMRNRTLQKNQTQTEMTMIAKSISKMTSSSKMEGKSHSSGTTSTQEQAAGLVQQWSEAVNHAKEYARSVQDSLGKTKGLAKTTTHSHGASKSTSAQISKALQQGESIASGIANSFGKNTTQSQSEGQSQSIQKSVSASTGVAVSVAWKLVFYTIAEETVLLAQELKSLAPRCYYLSLDGQEPVKVIAESCYALPTKYGTLDFFTMLQDFYKKLPGAAPVPTLTDAEKPIATPKPQVYVSLPETLPTKMEDLFEHFFPAEQPETSPNPKKKSVRKPNNG